MSEAMQIGTPLYQRNLEWSLTNQDEHGQALTRKIWDDRPFMTCAETGSSGADQMSEIMDWCRERFGPPAWPIHGKPGSWCRGSATVYGWTWFGFETQAMLDAFATVWTCKDES